MPLQLQNVYRAPAQHAALRTRPANICQDPTASGAAATSVCCGIVSLLLEGNCNPNLFRLFTKVSHQVSLELLASFRLPCFRQCVSVSESRTASIRQGARSGSCNCAHESDESRARKSDVYPVAICMCDHSHRTAAARCCWSLTS